MVVRGHTPLVLGDILWSSWAAATTARNLDHSLTSPGGRHTQVHDCAAPCPHVPPGCPSPSMVCSRAMAGFLYAAVPCCLVFLHASSPAPRSCFILANSGCTPPPALAPLLLFSRCGPAAHSRAAQAPLGPPFGGTKPGMRHCFAPSHVLWWCIGRVVTDEPTAPLIGARLGHEGGIRACRACALGGRLTLGPGMGGPAISAQGGHRRPTRSAPGLVLGGKEWGERVIWARLQGIKCVVGISRAATRRRRPPRPPEVRPGPCRGPAGLWPPHVHDPPPDRLLEIEP